MKTIDLNADIGEGFSFDHELCQYITSANICCGAHAGEQKDREKAIRSAIEHGVSIGAHPGYSDRKNFGRIAHYLPTKELREILFHQLDSFYELVRKAGAKVTHLKPHGALYNQAAASEEFAEQLLDLLLEFDSEVTFFALAHSCFDQLCREKEVSVVAEGFVDRRYQANGHLVSRSMQGSILNGEEALSQAMNIAENGLVITDAGAEKFLHCDSLCLHGDTEGALKLIESVHANLSQSSQVKIRAYNG